MKLLTANFITCAVKTCKSSPLSFPLHFRDAELEQRELDYNPVFLANILPRLDWDAIKVVAAELGFSTLPTEKPVLLPPPPPPLLGLQQMRQEQAAPSSSSKPPSVADAEMDEEQPSMADASATMLSAPSSSSSSSSSSLNQPPTTNAALESQKEEEEEEKTMRNLHTLLLETEVMEGKMVCGNCGHEYRIKEGIANFLLPAHLV